ncbi:MATE family efflux transporter [Bacillus sp. SCS-153A]|uniref:MATE family efflux transporter n=1 Tax=Rossellomorea sedimentorum TaxID=3115294 RepID=UPI003905C443
MLSIQNLDLSNKKMTLAILALALPAVVDNFFQTILGFVDTYFVAQLGLEEVAAVGVANTLLAIYIAVFMSLGVSVNVYVAKYLGSGNKEKSRDVAGQSIILSVTLGLFLGITTLLFAEPLLKMMGLQGEVLKKGVLYFRIVGIPSLLISLMFSINSILRGMKDTKTPMVVSIVINLLNILLDYILIFGLFFIPAFGLEGAAWATVISRLTGVILLTYFLNKKRFIHKRSLLRWDSSLQRLLLRLATPAMGERLAMRLGQVLYFGLIVYMGTQLFAAHQIAGNIEVFSYMIGYGFATAATTLVSDYLGAREYELAKKAAEYCVYLGVIFMSVFGIFLFFGGEWIGSFFTDEEAAIKNIGIALKVDAFIQPLLAVVLIMTGVYQGAENAKSPLYLTMIGIWIIRTIGVYLLGVYFGWGILGIWIAIGLDNAFRAIFLYKGYRNGKWLSSLKSASEA